MAIQALPEDDADFAAERESLYAKIDEHRKDMLETKPIGARIDSAREAVGRAQGRKADATQAFSLAQQVMAAAEAEVDKIAAELAELEAALAHTPGQEQSPSDSIEGVTQQMSTIMASIKSNAFVDPVHVQQAEAHIAQFINGFQSTMIHANAARAASDAHVRRRMQGKQEAPSDGSLPTPTEPFVTHKLAGKQPGKRVITELFAATPQNKRVFRRPATTDDI